MIQSELFPTPEKPPKQKMETGAIFSPMRHHRYVLWRIWDESLPKIMFIGLNPSTANETEPDNTIRRVISFAKNWGYGGVYMLNLFSIVSSDPKILLGQDSPIGPDYDMHLNKYAALSKDILFAWGSFKEAKERAAEISARFPAAVCLGFTKDGSPKHPLYISSKQSQVNYK